MANAGAFKKGDPRAAAAGRKSRRLPGEVQQSMMVAIRELQPQALTALRTGLENGDAVAMRLVVDRLAPTQLVTDIEVREMFEALWQQVADLTDELEEARTEIARLKEEALLGSVVVANGTSDVEPGPGAARGARPSRSN